METDALANVHQIRRLIENNDGRPLDHDLLAWHFPDESPNRYVWTGVSWGLLCFTSDWRIALPG